MKRKPWFPFYVDDFWQDESVLLMTLEEVGLYLFLLSSQWREGSIPNDVEKIARLSPGDPQAIARLWPNVENCFQPVDGDDSRLANPRLQSILEQQTAVHRKLSEQGQKGNRARWGKDRPAIPPPSPGDPQAIAKPETELDIKANNNPLPLLGADSVCEYCGVIQKDVDWAFDWDHFIPQAAGGSDALQNMIVACHVCNQIKQKRIFKNIEDARQHIHRTLWTKNRQRYATPREKCFGGIPPDGIDPVEAQKELSQAKTTRKAPTLPLDDFKPSESNIEWFRKKYGTVPKSLVESQTEQMLDYHRAKGNRFIDWQAVWRTWMTNWRTDFGKDVPIVEQSSEEPPRSNPNLITDDDD